jgi:hypothetical protein
MFNEIKQSILRITNESNSEAVLDILEKLDAISTNPTTTRNSEFVERIGKIDSQITTTLAILSALQNNFTGQCETPNNEIVYFSIEGARNEIKSSYRILTEGTFYSGYDGSFPTNV